MLQDRPACSIILVVDDMRLEVVISCSLLHDRNVFTGVDLSFSCLYRREPEIWFSRCVVSRHNATDHSVFHSYHPQNKEGRARDSPDTRPSSVTGSGQEPYTGMAGIPPITGLKSSLPNSLVGASGFEPPASCSQSKRSSQAELCPVWDDGQSRTDTTTQVAIPRRDPPWRHRLDWYGSDSVVEDLPCVLQLARVAPVHVLTEPVHTLRHHPTPHEIVCHVQSRQPALP